MDIRVNATDRSCAVGVDDDVDRMESNGSLTKIQTSGGNVFVYYFFYCDIQNVRSNFVGICFETVLAKMIVTLCNATSSMFEIQNK